MVIRKRVTELTSDEYRKCYSLNLREYGFMRPTLRHYKQDCFVYMIFDDNEVLLAWSIAFKVKIYRYPMSFFYVRQSHRKQGLAMELAQAMFEDYDKFHVEPWGEDDNPSILFFNKLGYRNGCIRHGKDRSRSKGSSSA